MIIFNLTVRHLMAGKKWILFCFVAVFPSLMSALHRMAGASDSFFRQGFSDVVIGAIVPIIALLIAGSAFASEIEEGTAVFLFAKPISRSRILLERFAGVAALATALSLGGTLASMLIQSGRETNLTLLMTAYGAATVFGVIVYSAIFLALSLITKRGIMIGLFYVLIWESTLAGQFAGTRTLSVKEYMLTIASSLAGPEMINHSGSMQAPTAIAFGLGLTAAAMWFALRKLKGFEVAGAG